MKRKVWGIAVAAVVVLAAGTTTAVVLSGGEGNDYQTLPTCDKLSSALPGKPGLEVEQDTTDQVDGHGQHLAYASIGCYAMPTRVDVELYRASNLDPLLAEQYPDKAVHDGGWRAGDVFQHTTDGLDALNSGVRYGFPEGVGSRCTVTAVKRNALVRLTLPSDPDLNRDQRKTACRQVAEKQMPKVLDAALG